MKTYDITQISLTALEILDRTPESVLVRGTIEGTIHPESADLLRQEVDRTILIQGYWRPEWNKYKE